MAELKSGGTELLVRDQGPEIFTDIDDSKDDIEAVLLEIDDLLDNEIEILPGIQPDLNSSISINEDWDTAELHEVTSDAAPARELLAPDDQPISEINLENEEEEANLLTTKFNLQNGELVGEVQTPEGEVIPIKALDHDPELRAEIMDLAVGEKIVRSADGVNMDGVPVTFTTTYVRTETGFDLTPSEKPIKIDEPDKSPELDQDVALDVDNEYLELSADIDDIDHGQSAQANDPDSLAPEKTSLQPSELEFIPIGANDGYEASSEVVALGAAVVDNPVLSTFNDAESASPEVTKHEAAVNLNINESETNETGIEQDDASLILADEQTKLDQDLTPSFQSVSSSSTLPGIKSDRIKQPTFISAPQATPIPPSSSEPAPGIGTQYESDKNTDLTIGHGSAEHKSANSLVTESAPTATAASEPRGNDGPGPTGGLSLEPVNTISRADLMEGGTISLRPEAAAPATTTEVAQSAAPYKPTNIEAPVISAPTETTSAQTILTEQPQATLGETTIAKPVAEMAQARTEAAPLVQATAESKPAQAAEVPKQVATMESTTAEAPVLATEAPAAITTEAPAITAEVPVVAAEAPALTDQEPAKATETSAAAVAAPLSALHTQHEQPVAAPVETTVAAAPEAIAMDTRAEPAQTETTADPPVVEATQVTTTSDLQASKNPEVKGGQDDWASEFGGGQVIEGGFNYDAEASAGEANGVEQGASVTAAGWQAAGDDEDDAMVFDFSAAESRRTNKSRAKAARSAAA